MQDVTLPLLLLGGPPISPSLCMHTVQDVAIPLFDKVKPEHVVPGMKALLEQLHGDITSLEAGVLPTWAGLVEPLERIQDRCAAEIVADMWRVRYESDRCGADIRDRRGSRAGSDPDN